MKKEKFGSSRDTRKHISENERKKGLIMFILITILITIFLAIVIIVIPKGNKDEINTTTGTQSTGTGTTVETQTQESNATTNTSKNKKNKSGSSDTDIIVKDKSKVSIKIKPGTLTVDGAVIVITDTNVSHYSWTPIYKLQKKVDGEWQDLELKNPENAIFADIEYDNETGVMEQSLVWSNKYGQIDFGEYRIVKEASGIEFYAEFEYK